MSKAFDSVRHSPLFENLILLGLSTIFIRLILIMYLLQFANVRWNGQVSDSFSLCNGVTQGAILSAILYCIYVNGLFETLRANKTGCWIKGNYLGMLGYADDNFLLSPTLEGLQEIINTCQEYALEHNLKFSTSIIPAKSKTKCMAFLLQERPLRKLKLGKNDLPWWNYGKHLGNKIDNSNNGMSQDLKEKRACFIDKNNELCQKFSFALIKRFLNFNDQIRNSKKKKLL